MNIDNKKLLKIFNNAITVQDVEITQVFINDNIFLELFSMRRSTIRRSHLYCNNVGNFNFPKVIQKLLNSSKKYEIELGLNLLLNEK